MVKVALFYAVFNMRDTAYRGADGNYRDDANGEVFLSSISPGEYLCSAQASLSIGNGSIFLGQSEYSNIQWAEI
jgi:hypothetical protein